MGRKRLPSPVYIQASPKTVWLRTRHSLGMHKLRYFRVSYIILESNFYKSAQSNGVEQYIEQSNKPLSQKGLLYHRCIMSDQSSNLLEHFLLVTLPYMNYMTSISIHKELQSFFTYHHVFCCPESVNIKWENPMVYCANFTQCICTGYCESWILFFLLAL